MVGDPGRTLTNGHFPHNSKGNQRDTTGDYSPLKVNDLAECLGHSTFRPIGEIAAAFLDRIEENARRQVNARHLINAALNCGADAVGFLEIIHAHLSPGHPMPAPWGFMAEAREWASRASTPERKAYLWACYETLPAAEQAAFLTRIGREEAA